DFSFRDATHRVQVDVRGNEVGLYKEYLKVPDQWIRDYEKLRSLNNTTSVVDTFAIMLLFLGLLVVIVAKVRHRDVKWKTAGIFGGITFVLVFLSSLNTFPRAEYGYQTTESYGGFLASQFFRALLAALGYGIAIFLITAGAEPLYRERYRDKISVSNLLRWRHLRTKTFFLSAALGLALMFF